MLTEQTVMRCRNIVAAAVFRFTDPIDAALYPKEAVAPGELLVLYRLMLADRVGRLTFHDLYTLSQTLMTIPDTFHDGVVRPHDIVGDMRTLLLRTLEDT
jgi:hypothetical protein